MQRDASDTFFQINTNQASLLTDPAVNFIRGGLLVCRVEIISLR
jgi:hypothetical protein